ncbi:hypothetical protein FRB91_005417 [Serendipita sp. 411]|nr:hypothetical protein FRB91_005417 [Serendipita sp. 411]
MCSEHGLSARSVLTLRSPYSRSFTRLRYLRALRANVTSVFNSSAKLWPYKEYENYNVWRDTEYSLRTCPLFVVQARQAFDGSKLRLTLLGVSRIRSTAVFLDRIYIESTFYGA